MTQSNSGFWQEDDNDLDFSVEEPETSDLSPTENKDKCKLFAGTKLWAQADEEPWDSALVSFEPISVTKLDKLSNQEATDETARMMRLLLANQNPNLFASDMV